ncbi:MAG TPA: winged helix DNA-binding domain-containing protein [Candidatus Limnocylindria bacterium]|nr:winged helix DNA-binding domain-containing protein [Candidatus Limnocylindria bacterium]
MANGGASSQPRLTARQLNRATLGRQLLLARRHLDVVDAVRAVCALQAQSAASPYIALWNRVAGFDPAEMDRAFGEHSIVKATLMRITLHAVAADDYPAFHRAMVYSLRRSRLGDDRFIRAGLSIADAEALVAQVLAFTEQPRTNAEMEAMLTNRVGALPKPGAWWALRTFAPVIHAPTGGPWSFGDRPSYVAAPLAPFDGGEEAALPILVRRYLEAFGPASAADIGSFTLIPVPPIRAALDVLADDLETCAGPDGKPLYDIRGAPLPPDESPAPPRLLGMWDSVLLAYRDRSRIIPEPYRKLIIRSNGDTLPTVLVDGYVAGVWRPAPERAGAIEATAFHPLDDATWDALEVEASSLVAFLSGRQPDVYRRYGRWWSSLPSAQVRLLAGERAARES